MTRINEASKSLNLDDFKGVCLVFSRTCLDECQPLTYVVYYTLKLIKNQSWSRQDTFSIRNKINTVTDIMQIRLYTSCLQMIIIICSPSIENGPRPFRAFKVILKERV